MNRRSFLSLTSLAGAGLYLGFSGKVAAKTSPLDPMLGKSNHPTELNGFVQITPDNRILFSLVKHEMGQGINTGLAQIFAEELGADWAKVEINYIDADVPKYKDLGGDGTGGSTTILSMYPILRKAGATAREMLAQAAANRWQIAVTDCSVANSQVTNRLTQAVLTFGDLAAEAAALPIPENPTLKPSQDFGLIGKSVTNKITPKVVVGQHRYASDMKVEGMLYASVVRCPVSKGKLLKFDASRALQVPGVKQVVAVTGGVYGHPDFTYAVRDGVAVIADSTWAAMQGRKAVTVEWDRGENGKWNNTNWRAFTREQLQKESKAFFERGNAEEALGKADKVIEMEYIYPFQVHSALESMNCIAHHKGETAEVWVGSQAPSFIISQVHEHMGLAENAITVHPFPSGGGFGRRYYPDVAMEALQISQKAGNIPVKVLWTREDEMLLDHMHYDHLGHYRVGLDKAGKVTAWHFRDVRTYFGSEVSWNFYSIPNLRYDHINLSKVSPLQCCAWRSVVANPWALQECAVDEVARKLKKDPLAFRLELLNDEEVDIKHGHKINQRRIKKVLQVAAEKSGYGKKMPKGQGQGLAVFPYMHGNSYCAQVADIEVKDGQLRVEKVVCAVDCGRVINPSLLIGQIEGGVIWGLSALLHGDVQFENGEVKSSNFHQHPVLRMDETPEIEVHLVNNDTEEPWGVGELGAPVVVPAVLNAIFAATGKRIRQLPLKAV